MLDIGTNIVVVRANAEIREGIKVDWINKVWLGLEELYILNSPEY